MINYLWRWHPKVALRYLPIIQKIKRLGLVDMSILEIGSGSLGIAPYLGKPVTGIDIDFTGPQIDLLTKLRGSAVKLPIANQSFNTVLMIDVLEHIPPQDRLRAIAESVRVTKDVLIIATPCGKLAYEEDLYLSKYYEKVHGKQFPFYKEHIKYGLPTFQFMNATIRKVAEESKRKITIEVEGNINLALHRFLMKGWMTRNFLIDIIFRKIFLLIIPLMLIFNYEPTYRKIFYIKFIK